MSNLVPISSANDYLVTHHSISQEFVTMQIGEQLFGISVMTVQDVLRRQHIAKVPLTSDIIAGSLNLRGRIVTAIDMRVRLGLPKEKDAYTMMNVVVEHHGELYSLLVDKVGEVMGLQLDDFEKVPTNLDAAWKDISSGVFKLDNQLLVILDVKSIINITI